MNDLQLCHFSGSIYTETPTGSVNGLEYGVYTAGKYTVVAVRGTEPKSMTDVLRDLRAWPWWNPVLGWCHCGFARGAVRVYEDLVKNGLVKKNAQLVFTGHSLGAAVSMKVAKLFSHYGYDVQAWVGFGCPRGWIGERVLNFSARTYVNGEDPVTRLPVGRLFDYRLPKDVQRIFIGETDDFGWIEDIPDHDIWNGYYNSLSTGKIISLQFGNSSRR